MIHQLYRVIGNQLERGFYIEAASPLSKPELEKIRWLVAETYEHCMTKFDQPYFPQGDVVEIGPRLSIETPFSSNAVAICGRIGLEKVIRIEHTDRFVLGNESAESILESNFDRMTQQQYENGILTFDTGIKPEPVEIIDLIGLGIDELRKQNKKNGWGMDERDINYYFELFVHILKRNPTNVELLQLGNANSEHSRHWYFKGSIVIDGEAMEHTLFEIVQRPLKALSDGNRSLIAFHDNAGAVKGFETLIILPDRPGMPSRLNLSERKVNITCTAETHNHPTAVAPFPGAQTGAGGRIRDNTAVGRGGIAGIGIAGYSVGNLFIPGYEIPGEVAGKDKLAKYASPLEILIEGSNGVTSYGNQFGEPLTLGFCRTYGQAIRNEWIEYRKPILYSAGIGHLFDEHTAKKKPEIGMCIVRIGGPAFPIGVGGGSASSVMPGQSSAELDFASVQRGNPQMENRANRVIRACVEMGDSNPIESIHDQGAGGPSNVLTELMEPLGGTINIRKIVLGDATMSVLQIWSAEFQEGYGLLIKPQQIELFQSICKRERVNCEILGTITGDGKVIVEDPETGTKPVDLNLKQILTNMPQKTFESTRQERGLKPLELPTISVAKAITAVFKLPSVGSKAYLVHKGDRSVTGLVAQQQCCGIEQIAISDYAVNAQSHFGLTGAASALGEQPIKMIINQAAGARMAVGEMLTNMAGARITGIGDIRCRANWMWPAKMPHEGARLYDAAVAMSDLMIKLGIAIDGGKDSLSMVGQTESGELVKAPGSLVVLGYAPMQDITKKVTPDIKRPGKSSLYLIDLGFGKNRLGGSALAQAFNQLGDESPDVDDPKILKNAFLAVQKMIGGDLILALHDRSDGGLITSVAEMCMASNCGFQLILPSDIEALPYLFNEELGFVIEVPFEQERNVAELCEGLSVPFAKIGSTKEKLCLIYSGTAEDAKTLLSTEVSTLRSRWESTSHQLERLQMDPQVAEEEYWRLSLRVNETYRPENQWYGATFNPTDTPFHILEAADQPHVAILREEGTNGDREMAAAFKAAGLTPWDIAMSDLASGTADLERFQGIVFAGGFSHMDVFDSAKGWAAGILFNEKLKEMFDRFYAREDTFSLGVCNGCQLMALLGWVPWKGISTERQPRFIHNLSGKFESRWLQVEVLPSPSILFSGMAGSRLGVWVAHGEGKLEYPDLSIQSEVLEQNLAPLAYIDERGLRTETYPYNPNGSPNGITALCSTDGRHTAMMPHPERSFRMWQMPWVPPQWKHFEASPWLRMFQNAGTWCRNHQLK